jgi:4-amino-4-deoxy-L-arabinose transferase-like glycosyltransferase
LRSPWLWTGLILLLAAGLKAMLLVFSVFPFNADEAIVGLMARHILTGERPVFFYGQAYMGSLDAWLTAAGFAIWGSQVWVIRLVQTSLYILTIIVIILIGRVAFHSWKQGLLAGFFLAIPAVNTTLYTTVSLGGYGEAMLIGSLGLLTGFWMLKNDHLRRPGWMVLWGGLLGLGLWANGLSLVFFLPIGVALLLHLLSKQSGWNRGWYFLAGLLGLLIGSAPWWLYAVSNGAGSLFGELGGSAVAVEASSFLQRLVAHLVNFVILGLPAAIGLRPPWEVRWLGLPLLPFVLVFWGVVIVFLFRRKIQVDAQRRGYAILAGILVTLSLLFVLTPFGVDPSGRYFLPIVVPLALGAAGFLLQSPIKNWIKAGMVGLVLVFNLWGTLDCALRQPPGITTQFYEPARVDQAGIPQLIQFLQENHETTGYTNYWVAYPLAFLSEEQLIFTPRLPYHPDLTYTQRDERYIPYAEWVEQADTTAYITTRNVELNERLSTEFSRLNITWQETRIGEFQVFYGLSRPVRPEELDLGETQP